MKKLILLAAVLCASHTPAVAQATGTTTNVFCAKSSFPGHDWKHTPREKLEGWSLPELATAHQYADSLHDASLMIVQCGRLVDEWGDSKKKITTFSVRKSLISALYGIYSTEGKIDINETLEQAGIDDVPSPPRKTEPPVRNADPLRPPSGVFNGAHLRHHFHPKNRPPRDNDRPRP